MTMITLRRRGSAPPVGRLAFTTLGVLLASAIAVEAQSRVRPKSDADEPPTIQGIGSPHRLTLSEDEQQRRSALKPLDAELIKPLLPLRLAGSQRASLDGETYYWTPPLGTTLVSAKYGDEGAPALVVNIVDPGGTPTPKASLIPIPEDGVREQAGNTVREGITVSGFRGVVETTNGSSSARLQIKVEPRVWVTMSSESLAPAQLREAAAQLDLLTLAALAPEPPPEDSRPPARSN